MTDNKVYLTTEKRSLWVLQAGRKCRVLAEIDLPYGMSVSPVAADGNLYVATHHNLYKITAGAAGSASRDRSES